MKNRLGIMILVISFLFVDASLGYIRQDEQKFIVDSEEIRGIYISYLEYYDYFLEKNKTISQAIIDKMIDNIKNDYFNTVFLHVSPFSDAIYSSNIFPFSHTLTGEEGQNPGFDYLEYFIKRCHLKNIKVHAWINPYRISFAKNMDKISTQNPAQKLLHTSSVYIDEKGIYYNPASEIVKDLIVQQVNEIINKYDVDGIHFDDYFYVQDDIDKEDYNNYLQNGGMLSLQDFRLYHTNELIKRVYKTIKKANDKIIFSIAPDGNINNNYLYHYADVKKWLSSNEYIDIIMPQIYYGFYNEYSPFLNVLKDWELLCLNSSIKVVPVLAIYKSGIIDKQAGSGMNEWINNSNIISKQMIYIYDHKLGGFALFRYAFLYNKAKNTSQSVKEIEKLRKVVEKYGIK